jgi:hypothetical protein
VCFAVASPAVAGGTARSITTGRIFRLDGHLDIIVGLARRTMTAEMASARDFETGHRAGPGGPAAVAASTDVAEATRRDWITFKNLSPGVSSATHAAAAPAAGRAIPVVSATPGMSAPAPQAAAAAEEAPAAPPPASSSPIAPAPPASYAIVAERLRTLSKLLESGLISQREYDEKRRAIINAL